MSLNICAATKRRVHVTAIQLTSENIERVAKLIGRQAIVTESLRREKHTDQGIWIPTGIAMYGSETGAEIGDWVVEEPKDSGRYHGVTDAKFHERYEVHASLSVAPSQDD